MPSRPEGITDADIVSGLYRWKAAAPDRDFAQRATILFSGSAQGAARAAAEELETRFGVGVDLWSATSYKVLRENALAVERINRLHSSDPQRVPRVTEVLGQGSGPVIAVSDFMKIIPEQIARFIGDRQFIPLGTDGMGQSDTREALRAHFEIDAQNIVIATLAALARDGDIKQSVVETALHSSGIDSNKPDPYVI